MSDGELLVNGFYTKEPYGWFTELRFGLVMYTTDKMNFQLTSCFSGDILEIDLEKARDILRILGG